MAATVPQVSNDAPTSPSTNVKSLRMRTNTAEIDSTITHPGSVKINVKGAFIVDQESPVPNINGGTHDTKDIRLPNHTAVVSHIAVDVCFGSLWDLYIWLLTAAADWRVFGKTCVFLTRTAFERARRTIELYKFRD